MMRMPLKFEDKIQLNDREYVIESINGEGATCIVYSAYYLDRLGLKHYVNIKECYPYSANICREKKKLIWSDEREKAQAFELFRDSYKVLVSMQNLHDLRNSTAHVFEIVEENGSIYSIMDLNNGITFDKEDCCLLDSLKAILALTNVVEKYHDSGYLHLDIKGSNFLTLKETKELVVLFDVDSVTAIKDISAGHVNQISFSEECAAPEQKQGQISKLCPATDIFAVGAVLFKKVMGRPVCASDMSAYAEWDDSEFNEKLFEDINPKVKKILRQIFGKTLSASIKRRYQSAAELIKALERAIDAVKAPYLLSNYPGHNGRFVGREEELLSIENQFADGKRLVCLTGIGGIGKSELAKRYASLHENDYDVILFSRYEDSIEELLSEIEIYNFEGSKKEHKQQLRKLLGKNTLLIIDNLDSEPSDFHILETLKCDVLITSRLDWSEYSLSTVEINELCEPEQLELFMYEFDEMLDEHQKSAVIDILRIIDGYTLLIPLLAKQLKKGFSDFDETVDMLRFEGVKAASNGKVRHLKDGTPMSGSVYAILAKVLDVAYFSEDEKYIMCSLTLLNKYRIDQNAFLGWIGREFLDQIDDLVFSSWVFRESIQGKTMLSLHSVIAGVCYEELNPNLKNCDGVANYYMGIAKEIATIFQNDDGYLLCEVKSKQLLDFLEGLDYSVLENFLFAIEVLYITIDSNIENVYVLAGDSLTYIVKTFVSVLPSLGEYIEDISLFKLINLIETCWCSDYQPIYPEEQPRNKVSGYGVFADRLLGILLEFDNWDSEMCECQFIEACKAADVIPSAFYEEAVFRVLRPALQCLEEYLEWGFNESDNRYGFACLVRDYFAIVEREYMRFCDEGKYVWAKRTISKVCDYIAYWDSINENVDDVEEEGEWEPVAPASAYEEWGQSIHFYPSPKQTCEILQDTRLSQLEKARLLALFTPFSLWYYQSSDPNANRWIEECPWEYFSQLIDIQIDLLWDSMDEWTDEDERTFGYASVNRAIVWLILEQYNAFEKQIKMLFDKYYFDTEDAELREVLSLGSFKNSYIGCATNALRCIKKSHWIFPFLWEHILYLEGLVESSELYSKEDLLDYYKFVFDVAKEADLEIGAYTNYFKNAIQMLRSTILQFLGMDEELMPK